MIDNTLNAASNEIIGDSRALRAVLAQVELVARTNSTVLIQGETGTGKELIARAIHQASSRSKGPFITLNCAAIPATLVESELFGHERGAFTGAIFQRAGRFEMANGGTLFLDEIGEIPLELQAKLLRVLQEQQFERLGATRSTHVDVRVVTATNCNLLQMVESKLFRADLYYRLSVFPIALPALRDRREDIPTLVRHFMARHSERMNKLVDEISPETMDTLIDYDWPGNIRQLQNFVEHGVILSEGHEFRAPLHQLHGRTVAPNSGAKTLDDATRDHIVETLKETKGVVGGKHGAAARLGLARTTLVSKMRRLGIATEFEKPSAFATFA